MLYPTTLKCGCTIDDVSQSYPRESVVSEVGKDCSVIHVREDNRKVYFDPEEGEVNEKAYLESRNKRDKELCGRLGIPLERLQFIRNG
jgi:hypothetical protein